MITCYLIFFSGQKKFICSSCNEENIVTNCFRDKAVEYELRNTTLKCLNQSCPWEGESRFYQVTFSFLAEFHNAMS